MKKEEKYIPSPEEYLAEHPEEEFEEYLDAYPQGWKKYIAPSIQKSLEEEHWPKGLPLIAMNDKNEIQFRYRNNRIEKEFINELQIVFRYKGFYLTGYLPIIFKTGDKVFVYPYKEGLFDPQYGQITKIVDKITGEELNETWIGYNFLMKIKGLDKTKIPTFTQHYYPKKI